MASNYPGSLDNFSTSHADGVNETIHASVVNDLADAVNKIESALGTNPVLSGSGTVMPTTAVTASTNPTTHTATTSERVILCDATSGRVEITLPNPSGNTGYTLTVRKTDPSTKNVFIRPHGTETLDGVNFTDSGTGELLLAKLLVQHDVVTLISDGTNWQRYDVGTATSGVLYVDATYGNDSYDGRSPWRAKQTIGAALTAATTFTTINIAKGTYVETVDLHTRSLGVRLVGVSGIGGTDLNQGTIVQAPSSTASALHVSTGTAGGGEIAHMTFMGNGATYTGTVFDGTGLTIGTRIHDVNIVGCPGDEPQSNQAIGAGVYGGIGLLINNAEQVVYDNIYISNCRVGFQNQGTLTNSKITASNFHFGDNYITYQDVWTSGDGGAGGSVYTNWKTQNTWARSYAIAILDTGGNQPSDGDTVTIRDQTYRLKNTMALANDVKIGATVDATLLSLAHAVNGTGAAGTDYFAGTVAPTGMQAGDLNLPDDGFYYLYTNDAVNTTNHRIVCRVTDTVGPDGNVFASTTTSTKWSFRGTTFQRADWGVKILFPVTLIEMDMMENIRVQGKNCWLFDVEPNNTQAGGGSFIDCTAAPETDVVVKSSRNRFIKFNCQGTFTIAAGATETVMIDPRSSGDAPPSSVYTDNGTGTRWHDVDGAIHTNNPPVMSGADRPLIDSQIIRIRKTGVFYTAPAERKLSNFTVTAGRTYFIPVQGDQFPIALADLQVWVVTGGAGATGYAGVYTPGPDWLPKTLFGRFTNVAVSAASSGAAVDFGAPFNSTTVVRGLTWLAVGFLGGTPVVTGVASGEAPIPFMQSATLSDLTGGGGQCYYQDGILSSVFPYFSSVTSLSVGAGSPAAFYKF